MHDEQHQPRARRLRFRNMMAAKTVVQSDNRQHHGRTIGGDGSIETVLPTADLGAGGHQLLGTRHGLQVCERIRTAARLVPALASTDVGAAVGEWRALAPGLVAEMTAVAEAAEVPFADVVAINVFAGGTASICAVQKDGAQHPLLGWAFGSQGTAIPPSLLQSCAVIVRGRLLRDDGDLAHQVAQP